MAGQTDFFSQDNTAGIDQSSFADRGSLIFDPGVNASLYSAMYDGSVTTIRMLPFFDKSQYPIAEVPYRGGPGFGRFSPWFMSYPYFKSIGLTNKVNLVVNDPYVSSVFDQNSNPLCVLSREIRNAVAHAKKNDGNLPPGRFLPNGGSKIPHAWYGLIEGSDGKSAAIPAMTSAVFVQCLIYQHKSKKTGMFDLPIGLRPDDGPIFFELSGSLWTSTIARDMNAPVMGYSGNPADFESAYVNGDPVSLTTGRFLHIFKKGCDPRSGAATSSDPYSQPTQGGQSGEKKAIGYDAFFTKTLPGYGPGAASSNFGAALLFPPEHQSGWVTQKIRDNFVPLRDAVRCHSPAQQAAFISSLFPAEILMYAWANHPQWITPDIVARASSQIAAPPPPMAAPAVSTAAPGATWAVPSAAAPAYGAPSQPAAAPAAAPAGAYQWTPPGASSIPGLSLPVPPVAETAASFPQSKVAPPVVAGGLFPGMSVPATPPTNPTAAPAQDPVTAGLPSAASDLTPAVVPAPASAPTPPGMTNIDQLKKLAGN